MKITKHEGLIKCDNCGCLTRTYYFLEDDGLAFCYKCCAVEYEDIIKEMN